MIEEDEQDELLDVGTDPEPTISFDLGHADGILSLLSENETALMNAWPLPVRRRLAKSAGLNQDPRFIRSRFAELFIRATLSLSLEQKVLPFQELMVAVVNEVTTALLENTDDADLSTITQFSDDEQGFIVQQLIDASGVGFVAIWAVVFGQQYEDDRLTEWGAAQLQELSTDKMIADRQEEHVASDDDLLFTPLDQIMIRAIVETATETPGSHEANTIASAVAELVRLNSAKQQAWFHAGFGQVLCGFEPDLPDFASNDERRSWFRFGRLTALLRLGVATDIVEEVQQNSLAIKRIISDPFRGRSITTGVISAELEAGADRHLVQMLEESTEDPHNFQKVFPRIYQRARELTNDEPALSMRMFRALIRMAGSAIGLETVDGTYGSREDVVADLRRRESSVLRVDHRFSDASRVIRDAPTGVSPWIAGLLATERGLIAAKVSHLSHLRWPESPEALAEQTSDLRRGAEDFRRAMDIDPEQHRASLLLGMIAMADGDYSDAGTLLTHAERGFAHDRASVADQLRTFSGALGAVALLLAHEGSVPTTSAALTNALESGLVLPARLFNDAAFEMAFRDPDVAAQLVSTAINAKMPIAAFQGTLEAILDNSTDGPRAERLVEMFVTNPGIDPSDRLDLHVHAICSALKHGSADVDSLLESAEDFVVASAMDSLDDEWSSQLMHNQVLHAFLGPDALFHRLGVLLRRGELEEASSIAERLFHRAASGDLDVAPEDLLEVLEMLGADEQELERLRRRLGPVVTIDTGDILAPIKVIFAGGNEVQQRYRTSLDTQISETWGVSVGVKWVFPGWSSNWLPSAREIEGEYPTSDALIVSYFMRTNLGRRIRRTSGESRLPWIACAGHGRDAMFRAVQVAVDVVQHARAGTEADM